MSYLLPMKELTDKFSYLDMIEESCAVYQSCNQIEVSSGVHCVLLGACDNCACHRRTRLANGT